MATAGDTDVLHHRRHAAQRDPGPRPGAGARSPTAPRRTATSPTASRSGAARAPTTIAIDATHDRAPACARSPRSTPASATTTSPSTSTPADDGFFVLDTQGALPEPPASGRRPAPRRPAAAADSVVVDVDGVIVAPAATSSTTPRTIGLLDSPHALGADVTVAISALHARLGRAATARRAPARSPATTVHGLRQRRRRPPFTRRRRPTFTLRRPRPPARSRSSPAVRTDDGRVVHAAADGAGSDDDIVHGETSTLPLIIFGGQGNDTIYGGQGGDVIFGDRGRVLYFDPTQPMPLPGTGARRPRAGRARGRRVERVRPRRPRRPHRRRRARPRARDQRRHRGVGGNDTITDGGGDDVILGGSGADVIDAGEGANVVLGDNGRVTAGDRAKSTACALAPLPQILGTSRRWRRRSAATTGSPPAAGATSCSAAPATTRSWPAAATTSRSATTARWSTATRARCADRLQLRAHQRLQRRRPRPASRAAPATTC